jgi:hypothetical protein
MILDIRQQFAQFFAQLTLFSLQVAHTRFQGRVVLAVVPFQCGHALGQVALPRYQRNVRRFIGE